MSEIVYRITLLLCHILANVPVGTNLGLFHLLWTILSGRFLMSRGAVFPALADLGLEPAAVRRANAALSYGKWQINHLLAAWNRAVEQEAEWHPHDYEGFRPLACDLVGYFRSHLRGIRSKHYLSQAGKALPALVVGLLARVGSVGRQRLGLLTRIVRGSDQQKGEDDVKVRLLHEAAACLADDQALTADAGFGVLEVEQAGVARFVLRVDKNATFRHNYLPAYKGQGRHRLYGEIVRPCRHTYKKKSLAATKPDATARWRDGRHTLRAKLFENLVLLSQTPDAPPLRCVVVEDPRYQDPWVLVTNLPISPYALWRLYRDRWAIEQIPLAAKQMLGAESSFVYGQESRFRLPELSLLAGNVLSYVAAGSQPMATGFWDRCVRATCGRLRRTLWRIHFPDLTVPAGEFRKKESPTGHLPKGVAAHRRQKATDCFRKLPMEA